MPLILDVPAQRAAPPKDLETRPKQVKAWLDSLPLAQSTEALRKIGAHVGAVNRAKLDPEDRVQILEAYRVPALALFEEMEAVYAKATLPLAPRARDCLTLARHLAQELAVGCKIALAERGGKLFGGKKHVPLLVHRALDYLAMLLRASYKSYTPVPEGVWREMHQLYLFADQERICAEVVDAETKDTVITPYVEALLLSLTDPYRLSPGEVDKVLAQVRWARANVTLAQSRPATPSGGHFIVPCDSDKPPKPALSANDDGGGPNWRLFDVNPLVEKMRMRHQAMQSGQLSNAARTSLPPELLPLVAKVVSLWGDPPKRSFRRNPVEGTVAICTGIKALSYFLPLEQNDARNEEQVRQGITMPLQAPTLDEHDQMVPVFEYDVVNESEGGLKVRRLSATLQQLAVGEVVGIKSPGKLFWAVGVVRWVTVFEEGGLEFGVQFLAPRALAVVVTPTIASSGTQPRGALLLSEDVEWSSEESLLTPSGTYSELREFEVSGEGGLLYTVRARNLIEKTVRFELFHVSPS